MQENIQAVSVVIASLGGGKLFQTIESINSGSLVPSEVLVCIPEQYIERISNICYSNVRIICTNIVGQVAQRAEGFRNAKESLVLQLDDDIELKFNALELMLVGLKKIGKSNVVGPIFINKINNKPLSLFRIGFKGILIDLYYYIFGALPFGKARMGCLSSICVTESIDPKFFADPIVKTQWLAGGCVLGYRDELIKENFYPFSGKAYAEDVLNSYLRSQFGILHNVVLDAYATIDSPSNSIVIREFIREMCARMYIVKVMRGSKVRKSFYIIAEIIRRIVWDLRQWKL